MSAVLEARAVITAEDRTGKAFDSLKARIAAISKQAEVMDRAMGAVGAVAKNVEGFKPLPGSAVGEMSKLVETVTRVDTAMANVNRSAAATAGNVGKTSSEVVGLSGKLMDAGAKLKAISDFKGTSRGVKDASLAFQKAQQDERLLAARLDGIPNPARSMQAAHAGALAEIRATEKALQAQVAVASAARTALGELGVPVSRLASEEERLKSVLAGTNDALLRQIQLERESAAAATKAAAAQRLSAEQDERHHKQILSRIAAEDHAQRAHVGHAGGHADHGFANYALTSAAMAVSAHEIGHVIAEGWHEGAELQHERMQLKNAGRTPQEMREIEAAGRKSISELPTANFTESMKVIAETTSAFGSVHHAIDNLDFMMKSMSVLKSAGGAHIHGDAASVGQAFAKTFEERQTRPEDFQKEASAMIPAMVATGGLFNPEQLYAFAQQAKSALPSLSMRFLSKIAPSLITTQGGEQAGTALKSFESVIAGKVNDKKQAEAFLDLGLLDKNMAVMKAGHAVGWKSGAIKDTRLAMTDPLEWAETYLIPALKKKGIDTSDREAVQMVLNTLFRNNMANQLATELVQEGSRNRLHKDEALYNRTGTLDEIYKNDLGEFNVAAGALGDSLKTLAAAATAPMMHSVGESLSWLAGALNQVSAFGLRHPTIAATAGVGTAATALAAAGWLGKKLFEGFGLKGSAVALTGSAEALTVAAGRLGMSGRLPGSGGPGRVAGTAAGGAGAGGAAGRVVNGGPGVAGAIEAAPEIVIPGAVTIGSAAIAGGIAVATIGLVKASAEAQAPGKGGQWSDATEATRNLDQQRLADQKVERERLRAEIDRNRRLEKIPGFSDAINMPLVDQLGQLDGEIAKLERSIVDLDAVASPEARVGRAMMAMPKPEAFGPEMPKDWSTKFGRVLGPEQLGPNLPPLPDTDRADRARQSDLSGISRSFHGQDGNALRHQDEAPPRSPLGVAQSPVVPAPVVDRDWSDARTKDDTSPYQHVPIRMTFGHQVPEPAAPIAPPSLMKVYDSPSIDDRTLGRYIHIVRPAAEAGEMPRATPPSLIDRSPAPGLMRAYDAPPAPLSPRPLPSRDIPPVAEGRAPSSLLHPYDGPAVPPAPLVSGGGPVPVQIVGGGPPTASAAPPPVHDAWLDGDRPGIEERSRRGAAMFRQDHEGTVGRRLMEHEAPEVSPHVDTSGLDEAKTKSGEAHDALAALAAMVISPSVNSAALDALIAKAMQAKALIASLGNGGGGTSGAVGTTYATTAPTGRQMGPR